MTYERLKALLWPHVVCSLGLLILIDYVVLIGFFVQVIAGAYLGMQLLAFLCGVLAGGAEHLANMRRDKDDPSSVWTELFNYNIVRFFPLLPAGRDWFAYLMTERDPKGEADGTATGDGRDDREPRAHRAKGAPAPKPQDPDEEADD